mmetsp:Transcript_8782/g.17212  ORF Transcript_8782/g.17212 Transcript_8782/m.17212 type:complete len:248 (-) Transcript_8782:271-1014(-)|eukprot:CAMPEP_0170167382 /NCGR_PEP_ID=MMETSP0040_2-20121228/801_1 /TAXON_ID=641309 /ORGANISM="Lotharella oceanica, Strain CCMP622" /LENGTH=247 /DNA_ID=CAMNT_0010405381 /DNA_START=70 /DNA_END=813 /DNA_ORIENTATION=+
MNVPMRTLTLTLALLAASANARGCQSSQLFDVFETFSEYQRDVVDHMSRQFKCAGLCAERNREVRRSSLVNTGVHVVTETDQSGLSLHRISIDLPKVKPSDIVVKIVGDNLLIRASRTWSEDMLPEMTEKHKKCGCEDIAEGLLGQTDAFSTQLRIPSTVARNRIDVEFRRDTDELVISLPEKEPAILDISVREVTSDSTASNIVAPDAATTARDVLDTTAQDPEVEPTRDADTQQEQKLSLASAEL